MPELPFSEFRTFWEGIPQLIKGFPMLIRHYVKQNNTYTMPLFRGQNPHQLNLTSLYLSLPVTKLSADVQKYYGGYV